MSVHQKFGILLENKSGWRIESWKNVFTKNWSPKTFHWRIQKKSFEYVDSWPKILLSRTHHLWNCTNELILNQIGHRELFSPLWIGIQKEPFIFFLPSSLKAFIWRARESSPLLNIDEFSTTIIFLFTLMNGIKVFIRFMYFTAHIFLLMYTYTSFSIQHYN